MEFSAMQMYWLLMLDNIRDLFVVIIIILMLIAVVFLGLSDLGDSLNPQQRKKWAILFIFAILFCSIAVTFIPATKQMAAIIVVPKIINNEKVQQMPEELLNLGMDWLGDLKSKKEK